MTETPETRYCYHCRTRHPAGEVRRIVTKTGIRWRCVKSIEAAKASRQQREAFGKEMSRINSAESAAAQLHRRFPRDS